MAVYFSIENTILGSGKNIGNHSPCGAVLFYQWLKGLASALRKQVLGSPCFHRVFGSYKAVLIPREPCPQHPGNDGDNKPAVKLNKKPVDGEWTDVSSPLSVLPFSFHLFGEGGVLVYETLDWRLCFLACSDSHPSV